LAGGSFDRKAPKCKAVLLTLIDTNVPIDLATNDPIWADWSQYQLDTASMRGPLFIDEMV
jgi:hypothetical protein